jgi:hypothetical protein
LQMQAEVHYPFLMSSARGFFNRLLSYMAQLAKREKVR